MRGQLHSFLLQLGDLFKSTRVGNSQIVQATYNLSKSVLDPGYTEYEGFQLYCPYNETIRKYIEEQGGHEEKVRNHIIDILDEGDVAFDIGAHYGHHSLTMSKAVYSGRVYAFEPHPDTAGNLERTIKKNAINNITLIQEAVGNTAGKQIMSGRESSTLRDPELVKSDKNQEYTIVKRRLDTFIKEKDIEEVDLMKVDIEGGEYELFKNIEGEIDIFQNIILELHADILGKEKVKYIYELLQNSGSLMNTNGEAEITEFDEFYQTKDHIVWNQESG